MLCVPEHLEGTYYLAHFLVWTGLILLAAGCLLVVVIVFPGSVRRAILRRKKIALGLGLAYPILALVVGLHLVSTIGTVREKITWGLSLASAAKTAVSDYYLRYGDFPSKNEQAGMASSDQITSFWVQSVSVGEEGKITVTFNEICENHTIVIRPIVEEGLLSWDCRGGSLPEKYRPSSCRKPRY